jgi:hypothetical protein
MSKLDLFFSPNYADWLLLRVFLQDYVSTYFAVQAWKRFVQKQYEMLCESVQVMREHGYYLVPGEKESGYVKIENLLQGLVNHTNKGDSDFLGVMSLVFPINFHELGTMPIRVYQGGPSIMPYPNRFQKYCYVPKCLDAWQKMPQ